MWAFSLRQPRRAGSRRRICTLFLARTMRLVRVAAWLVATPRAPTRLSPLRPSLERVKKCPPNDFASSIFVKGGRGGIVPKGRTELVHRKLHARLPCKSLALRHLSYYHIHSCHIYLASLRCYTHAMCTLILRQPCHLQAEAIGLCMLHREVAASVGQWWNLC